MAREKARLLLLVEKLLALEVLGETLRGLSLQKLSLDLGKCAQLSKDGVEGAREGGGGGGLHLEVADMHQLHGLNFTYMAQACASRNSARKRAPSSPPAARRATSWT